jgi:hypothetical protein
VLALLPARFAFERKPFAGTLHGLPPPSPITDAFALGRQSVYGDRGFGKLNREFRDRDF